MSTQNPLLDDYVAKLAKAKIARAKGDATAPELEASARESFTKYREALGNLSVSVPQEAQIVEKPKKTRKTAEKPQEKQEVTKKKPRKAKTLDK